MKTVIKVLGVIVGILVGISVIAFLIGSQEGASTEQEGAPTQPPAMSVAEIKSTALEVSYDDLMRYNENYIGKIVYYPGGEIFQVAEGDGDRYTLLVSTKVYLYYSEDNVYVNYEGERLLEGDIVDLWGKVKGLKTYTAVLGNEVTIPELDALHVELVTKAGEK